MKNNKLISVFLSASLLSTCGNHQVHKPLDCISSNDSAEKIISEIQMSLRDQSDIDLAILLLKESVNCDSSNLIFSRNLIDAFAFKENYDSAIFYYNQSIQISSDIDPYYITLKGFLFKKLNLTDSSIFYLQQAESKYLDLIERRKDNLYEIESVLILYCIMNGKQFALKKYSEFMLKYPSSQLVKFGEILKSNNCDEYSFPS